MITTYAKLVESLVKTKNISAEILILILLYLILIVIHLIPVSLIPCPAVGLTAGLPQLDVVADAGSGEDGGAWVGLHAVHDVLVRGQRWGGMKTK